MASGRRSCDHLPSKQAVAGSSPVSRSFDTSSLFAGCLHAVWRQTGGEKVGKEAFVFLVDRCTMTTCPDLGETPVSSTLDTCLVKHANTCHCLLVSTCLLSLPVNGLPSKKERLCM